MPNRFFWMVVPLRLTAGARGGRSLGGGDGHEGRGDGDGGQAGEGERDSAHRTIVPCGGDASNRAPQWRRAAATNVTSSRRQSAARWRTCARRREISSSGFSRTGPSMPADELGHLRRLQLVAVRVARLDEAVGERHDDVAGLEQRARIVHSPPRAEISGPVGSHSDASLSRVTTMAG